MRNKLERQAVQHAVGLLLLERRPTWTAHLLDSGIVALVRRDTRPHTTLLRTPEDAALSAAPPAHIDGRSLYGEGTRKPVGIYSGYEKISLFGGYNFPHVAGPFKGRGWMKRLGAAVEKHLATLEK